MATVITNLLSAIPVFGQDLVESNYIAEKIICFGNENFFLKETVLPVLPTVGTVSKHAFKKGRPLGPYPERDGQGQGQIRLDKRDYLSIPYPFIAFLVGLIDGDGYIQITKTTRGYIAIKLVICLGLEDISTLEYIHSVLKLGKLTIYRDNKRPNCRLIINRTDLQEILFPLLIHHNIFFLTEARRAQFDLAMFILKSDLKFYDKIPNIKEIPTIFKLPETASDYLKLAFFKNWLVGFTNAEGSFLIKNNNEGCFQLKQRTHVQLFESFKLLFNTKRNIFIEQDKYVQFSVSSKTEIQTVINFFSFLGLHPLIGLKCISYFKWLSDLQNSSRYRNLNFPK